MSPVSSFLAASIHGIDHNVIDTSAGAALADFLFVPPPPGIVSPVVLRI